jgi:hypothetical protein
MNDHEDESRPVVRILRRLRRDEALIEMVRAERVFLANCTQLDAPVKPRASRPVEIGLKAKNSDGK